MQIWKIYAVGLERKTSQAFPTVWLRPSGLPNSLLFNLSYTFVMNKLFQKSLRVKPPTVLKDM
jgi:hypothetical protein